MALPSKQLRKIVVAGVLWTPTYPALGSPGTGHLLCIRSQAIFSIFTAGGPGATGIVPAALETSDGRLGNDH